MRLVVFDVDGTLIDSQSHIHRSMTKAFEGAGLPPLPKARVLSIVGLSLPVAVAELVPDLDPATRDRIVKGYKQAFMAARKESPAPLYDGARECLDLLGARDDLMLAVATGKSRRGLDAMIEAHGLQNRFLSLQTADGHPSKPHPAMLMAAMSECGADADRTAMIGDTSFDMQMARGAGATGIGVAWGYHDSDLLRQAGAARIAPDFAQLERIIGEWAA
ncbi:HAD-IA family hydrolase [Paracoccus sp. 1_MG-2023]|uniref:HAD-IA family hydrolase n=1 Tax=unclassified Paracoccus (in: a-proteobacteria) TaxID=2688777 RepID=UPI001C0A290F|nr:MULTISPECIES: HAD-IA family hydrolase [unclassified Paracoccus (in: a-proteobacteria)]MBU2957428.1 HAD-IA family hydrolase [Paracoccus sp. C2R09]MDO6669626.1 HAD-IA family hydrolase [Paracoccus sp. 1_MG-2023]